MIMSNPMRIPTLFRLAVASGLAACGSGERERPSTVKAGQNGDEGEAHAGVHGALKEVHIVADYRTRIRPRCLPPSDGVRRVRQRTDALHEAAMRSRDLVFARAIDHVRRAFDPVAGPVPGGPGRPPVDGLGPALGVHVLEALDVDVAPEELVLLDVDDHVQVAGGTAAATRSRSQRARRRECCARVSITIRRLVNG